MKDSEGNTVATAYLEGIGRGAAWPVVTSTTLVANPSINLVAGEPITLTATVTAVDDSATPTGTVTFADPAGGSVQMLLVDGKASYYGKVPRVGTYSVYASYNGGPGFAESKSATITRAVTAPSWDDIRFGRPGTAHNAMSSYLRSRLLPWKVILRGCTTAMRRVRTNELRAHILTIQVHAL